MLNLDIPANSPSLNNKKRIVWIDYARAFAILTVILCHSTEAIYSFKVESIAAMGMLSQVSAFSLFTIGRLGVPIFLFMSGYLMLDRSYDREACIRFWKAKWLGLLFATEIWIVIYNIFLSVHNGQALDLFVLTKNMLFLERVGMGHMWYMPMIIGLYLFLPFMANGLKRLDDVNLLRLPLMVSLLVIFVTPILSVISQSFDLGALNTQIADGFSGGAYGCYMLLGYCVKKRAFSKRPRTVALIAMLLICFALTVGLQIFAFSRGVSAAVWYTNGLLLLTGLSSFLLFSRGGNLRKNRIISMLSYYSFALYLVHFPVKILFTAPIESIGFLNHGMQVLLLSVVVLVVSLLICAIIARIPKVGAKILYLR